MKKTGKCCTDVQSSGICEGAKNETADEGRSSRVTAQKVTGCLCVAALPPRPFFFRIASENSPLDIALRQWNFCLILGV